MVRELELEAGCWQLQALLWTFSLSERTSEHLVPVGQKALAVPAYLKQRLGHPERMLTHQSSVRGKGLRLQTKNSLPLKRPKAHFRPHKIVERQGTSSMTQLGRVPEGLTSRYSATRRGNTILACMSLRQPKSNTKRLMAKQVFHLG